MIKETKNARKKSKKSMSQGDFLLEYYKSNPNRDIEHPEIVDWVTSEYRKRTGKVFRDPDRGIRKLHQEGYLIKVKKGIYKYDPDLINKRELEDFSPKIKEAIFKRDGYKCVVCGLGRKNGVEIHADHIKPKDKGGQQLVGVDITKIAKDVGWKYFPTIIWDERNISRRIDKSSFMSTFTP